MGEPPGGRDIAGVDARTAGSDAALAERVRAGEVRALAKAITLVESTRPGDRSAAIGLLEALPAPGSGTIRIGITGSPGVGKSTFIEAFGLRAVEAGHRIAVLTIDPSSRLAGGSILGDKTPHAQALAAPRGVHSPDPRWPYPRRRRAPHPGSHRALRGGGLRRDRGGDRRGGSVGDRGGRDDRPLPPPPRAARRGRAPGHQAGGDGARGPRARQQGGRHPGRRGGPDGRGVSERAPPHAPAHPGVDPDRRGVLRAHRKRHRAGVGAHPRVPRPPSRRPATGRRGAPPRPRSGSAKRSRRRCTNGCARTPASNRSPRAWRRRCGPAASPARPPPPAASSTPSSPPPPAPDPALSAFLERSITQLPP